MNSRSLFRTRSCNRFCIQGLACAVACLIPTLACSVPTEPLGWDKPPGSADADDDNETPGHVDDALIDDLEDGDADIEPGDGRVGQWHVYNDETGGNQVPDMGETFEPRPGGNGSNYCAGTRGDGFTSWGAGLAADLNSASRKGTYDASAYRGISFAARSDLGHAVRVGLTIAAVVPQAEGGTCESDCYNSHGAYVTLGDEWQKYSIAFDELEQEFGTPSAFDASTIMTIEFDVAPNLAFDFCVDDLRFD